MGRITLVLVLAACGAVLAASASSAPLRVATAPIVQSFTPTSGPLGTQVKIKGSHFTGASKVRFNGVDASEIVVNSDSTVTATVAPDDTSGKISVVTPGGTGTSTGTFTVTPGFTNLKVCAATNARPVDPTNSDTAMACPTDQGGTSFAPGDALVCGFEEYNSSGHTVSMDWTRNGVPVTPSRVAAPIAADTADHWFWWNDYIKDPSVPTGSWACRIKLDGAVVQTRTFNVVSSTTRAPLTVSETSLDSLDPALAYFYASWRILSATCAGLLGWKDGGPADARTLFPDAATAMPTVSANGLTYTFTIRSGMKFAPSGNGLVTPQSFVRAFQRAAKVPGSPAGYFLGGVKGFDAYASGSATSISGVSVSGSQLKIVLTSKQGNFLARLAMPFFCAVPAAEPLTAQTSVPSAGPYYIAPGADPNTGLKLLRNPGYGGVRPHGAAEIDVLVSSVTSRYAIWDDAFDAGFAFNSTDWQEIYAQYGSTRAFQWPGASVFQLVFDFSTAKLTTNVRKAIATGISRTALAASNGGIPTSSLLATTEAGYTNTGPYSLNANITGARTLMTAAGYSPTHRLALTLLTGGGPTSLARANALKSQLASIYIDLTIDQEANVYGLLSGTNWDIATIGWIPDFPDPWDNLGPLFQTGAPANYSRYASATFDTALAAADAKTGSARATAFATLAKTLATGDVPATTYETFNDLGFFSTRVECIDYGAFGVNLALLNDKNTGAACGTDAAE